MKTNLLALAAVALLACEGEPPKTAVNPTPAPAAEATEAPAAEPSAEPAAPEPAAPAHGCNCECGCKGHMGHMAAAAGDAGVPAEPEVAAAPPAPTGGSVVGHVTLAQGRPAANAVVFFEDGPVDPPAKRAPLIDNHMMNFSPFVQVVQAGNRVVFQNSDPFPHNVFSPDNGGFNVGIIAQHATSTRVFKSPGEYSLLCNLHPGMLGYLVVTPNGHFAKADATGRYAIKDVPAGTYQVTAWAPRQKPHTQSVTVQTGDVTLDFELHR